MYGEKIKTIRELRGFSQEYLADQLGIAQNTYSKIETGQTRLNADTLKKIAQLLGVSPVDILSNQPVIINFESGSHLQKNPRNDHYTFQKEFVDRLVESKEKEIEYLKEIISALIKEKESLFRLFEK